MHYFVTLKIGKFELFALSSPKDKNNSYESDGVAVIVVG